MTKRKKNRDYASWDKEKLEKEARKRKLEVARADDEDGDPLKDDYVTALTASDGDSPDEMDDDLADEDERADDIEAGDEEESEDDAPDKSVHGEDATAITGSNDESGLSTNQLRGRREVTKGIKRQSDGSLPPFGTGHGHGNDPVKSGEQRDYFGIPQAAGKPTTLVDDPPRRETEEERDERVVDEEDRSVLVRATSRGEYPTGLLRAVGAEFKYVIPVDAYERGKSKRSKRPGVTTEKRGELKEDYELPSWVEAVDEDLSSRTRV